MIPDTGWKREWCNWLIPRFLRGKILEWRVLFNTKGNELCFILFHSALSRRDFINRGLLCLLFFYIFFFCKRRGGNKVGIEDLGKADAFWVEWKETYSSLFSKELFATTLKLLLSASALNDAESFLLVAEDFLLRSVI